MVKLRIPPRLLLVLRYVLLAAVVAFAVYYLASQWGPVTQAISEIAWQSAALSFVLLLLGLFFGTLSWTAILNGLGPRVPTRRAAQILLVGQLGKYVPGSVWSYVMQMELGRQFGILRPRILITSLYAAGVGVVASLVLGAAALPVLLPERPQLLWLFALLPLGLLCLHPRVMTWLASQALRIFRRPPLTEIVSFRVVLQSTGFAVLAYASYGTHLWILVNSLEDPDLLVLVLLMGAVALAFTASLFAFILPSGIGVRDGILVAAMALVLTIPEATSVTVVSRVMFTAADLLAAAVATMATLVLRRRLQEESVRYSEEESRYEAGTSTGEGQQ